MSVALRSPGTPPARMLRMLALALCAPLTGAKLIEAHFNGLVTQYAHADHDMAYLGKFAFQCVGECGRHYGNKLSSDDTTHMLSYESGMVRVVAHGGYEPGQVLAVFLSENFYDRTRSWRNVFKNRKLTCAQKLEKAVDVIQLSPAPPPNASSTYDEEHLFDDQTVQRTEYIELTARPQFFHFAAMNCQRGSLYTYIELKLFNPGSFRTRHFSFEDQGLLGLETTMLAISTLLALLALEGVLSLKSNRLHHPPLLVLHNALWLLVISHALAVYFYSSYSTFGRGPEFALLCSELLYLSTDLIVMVLSLLIARGWRVTSSNLEPQEAMLIGASAALYVFVYALVYCIDMITRDPADDVYPLMTGGALWLIFFRLCLGGLCAMFVLRTYHLEMSPPKRHFYRRFISVSALWFLSQPISIVVALSMDEWIRHKNATVVLYTVSHSLIALVLYVLRPARAASYFTMTAYADELDGLVSGAGARRDSVAGTYGHGQPVRDDGYGRQHDEHDFEGGGVGARSGGATGAWRDNPPASRYRDDAPHVELHTRPYREEPPHVPTPEPADLRPEPVEADLLGGAVGAPPSAAGTNSNGESRRGFDEPRRPAPKSTVAEEQDGML